MMTRERLAFALAFAMASFGVAKAGPLDLPKPEVFIRAEDQERARLLGNPCKKDDIGRGCYSFNGFGWREAPCTYHIDDGSIGSLPTDQCYKMEEPRRYQGIWIDAFEGQRFIPTGTTPPAWPTGDPNSPGWRAQADRAQAAAIWLDVERVKLGHDFRKGGRKMLIDFIGRKTMFPGSYGHLGMSGNEIIVDRIISIKKAE